MSEEAYYLFDERFAEAFLHRRSHVVLGRRLNPFSFWHKLQLEWINSKILLGGAGNWDLWLAVQICSSSYPHQGKLPPRKIPSWWRLLWNLRHALTDWKKEMVKFHEYLSDFHSPPKTWGGQASAKQRLAEAHDALYAITNAPEDAKAASQAHKASDMLAATDRQIDDSLEQIAAYCKRAGRPPSEAWNMGLGEICWMNTVFYQMDGGKVEIWTPSDQMRFDEHLKKRFEAIAKLTAEILLKYPEFSKERADAEAAVQYWATVVGNVDAGGK